MAKVFLAELTALSKRTERKEVMKRDEVKELFPEATEEQIDAILNKTGAEINSIKGELDKANKALEDSKASSAKIEKLEKENAAHLEQIKALTEQAQAGMTAEERLAQMQQETEAQKLEFQRKSNELDARAIFVEAGFTPEQCDTLISQVVSEDSDKTKALAQCIVETAKATADATAQQTKDELLKGNPSLQGAGGSDNPVTKQEFDKLSYTEQVKLLQDNPDLLKSFDNKPVPPQM